ncbi:MAG: nitrite/sulfite reductase [Sulfuricurvum sp.]|nr:nitrite/sulfite reductase [Sulfuricurvum sp.]
MASETKAQRVERIKSEKDGLDVLDDIARYAISGEEIDPEDIDRFKWYGLYTQNKNLQGPEDETLYFMLRIKVEGGYLNREQLAEIGKISKELARDTADLTTRQDIQFHWIKVTDLPQIFARLAAVGLSTIEAAGDCPRNIVCCPVNGIDKDQVDDVRDLVDALNDLYRENRAFSNLPRKFKVGVSGCSKHCLSHEVQDLTFTAVQRQNGGIEFSVSVGGGQASNRRIADHIGYIQRKDVVAIAQSVAKIYRDYGRRDNRLKARLGHLIEDWGVERFVNELEKDSGVTFDPYDHAAFTPYPRRSHFGIFESTKEGYNTIGYAITSGRIGGERLLSLGNILEFYGAEGISLTTTQNIVVQGVPSEATKAFTETLEASLGLEANPSVFEARTLACTGLNFCKFAVSETKNLAIEVVAHLKSRFKGFSEPVSISINGCPNACAHPHIVDLGFVGSIVKRDEEKFKGFDLIVGGHLEGEQSRFAVKTGVKVTSDEVAPLIESLIQEYESSQSRDFGNFLLEKYRHEPTIPTAS